MVWGADSIGRFDPWMQARLWALLSGTQSLEEAESPSDTLADDQFQSGRPELAGLFQLSALARMAGMSQSELSALLLMWVLSQLGQENRARDAGRMEPHRFNNHRPSSWNPGSNGGGRNHAPSSSSSPSMSTTNAMVPPRRSEPLGPVDINALPAQQQYDYFKNLVQSQGGTWKEGDGEANIIGVRSMQDGRPVQGVGNTYDDTFYVVRTVGGQPQIEAFKGSVDAGVWSQSEANARGFGTTTSAGSGIAHLADGFYRDTWRYTDRPISAMDLGTGLAQNGNIRVHADVNGDGVISGEEMATAEVGAGFAIQFHRGGAGQNVGTWSAGCQVIVDQQYDRFAALLRDAHAHGQNDFSYLLIDSSNLTPTH